jgi:hypothetical protein
LNALAGVLRDSKRTAEAETIYRRALDIRQRAFKPGNSDLAETAGDYAKLLRETGRAAEADALTQRYSAK